QNNSYTTDNPIIFLSYNATEERFRWNLASTGAVVKYDAQHPNLSTPFNTSSYDLYYQGYTVYYIEKSTLTGHDGCIGLKTNYGSMQSDDRLYWENCTTNPYTTWVEHNNFFINIGATNVAGPKIVMSEWFDGSTNSCENSNFKTPAVYSTGFKCNV